MSDILNLGYAIHLSHVVTKYARVLTCRN